MTLPVEYFSFPTTAHTHERASLHTNQRSLVIRFRSELSIRHTHLFGRNIDHDDYFELKFMEHRVADSRILRLIQNWLNAFMPV
jgi:hypothetical protein